MILHRTAYSTIFYPTNSGSASWEAPMREDRNLFVTTVKKFITIGDKSPYSLYSLKFISTVYLPPEQ